jgi:hypothetical protein
MKRLPVNLKQYFDEKRLIKHLPADRATEYTGTGLKIGEDRVGRIMAEYIPLLKRFPFTRISEKCPDIEFPRKKVGENFLSNGIIEIFILSRIHIAKTEGNRPLLFRLHIAAQSEILSGNRI